MWMFKKEDCLDSHNWHVTVIDKPGNSCFFNWRLEQFSIGIHLHLTTTGIDYYIGFWASLHGNYIWDKNIRYALSLNKLEELEY